MVNICHIVSGDLWAGAEVMMYSLLKELTKYPNIRSSAIVLNDGRLANELQKLGIPLHLVNESKTTFLRTFLDIKKVLTETSPDIIHSHRYKENLIACLASKTGKGVQLIATQHGMPEVYGGKNNLKHRLVSKLNFLMLSKCFNHTVAVSKDIQMTFVSHYGFSEDKVKMIHNGVEVPQALSAKHGNGLFVIGSSGRFFPVKDYPLMVEIAHKISKKTDNIRFELAGDGPERAKIQSLIKRYGLENNFILRGFVENMAPFYQGLDLYLNTSLHEGIPMGVLEAMAHGLPVVAPNVGGLSEIVKDGKDGYLVKGRNPEEFTEKCLRIYENTGFRQQMKVAAKDKVLKEFSIEQMAQKYFELYLDAANNH